MGDFLIEHPAVSLIAFTGSMEVGLRIVEKAGRTPPAQPSVKKVIAEMGGKNAILIDDDADLDEAVPAVMRSAFGYQGQKCSACSESLSSTPSTIASSNASWARRDRSSSARRRIPRTSWVRSSTALRNGSPRVH